MDLELVTAGRTGGSMAQLDLPETVEALIASAGDKTRPSLRVADDGGNLHISGEVSNVDAFETIVALAEVYSGLRVVSELTVRPRLRVRSPSWAADTTATHEFERKLP